ncbi:MAG: restriction endonuclease subunit S [Nitrosomonas sp.]
MSFPRYESYKDSGVEWLGEVPEHWVCKPFWTLYRRTKRTGYVNEQLLSVYRDYGVIPKASRDDNNNKPSDDLNPYQLVKVGDLAINKMKAWQGSVAISEYQGIVSPAYFVYESTNDEISRFLHYLMRSSRYITGYLTLSKGIRVNQWDLEPQYHSRMSVVLPPKDEQQIIATFLDRETAKIDALIAEQQRLIELLKEKRQSVISHAVTKGLNPNVPMKDSGIEWLGEVPKHWGVVPLRWFASCASGNGISIEQVETEADTKQLVPVIGGNGVMGYTNLVNVKHSILAVGRVGALCGNVHIVNPPAWVTDNALILDAAPNAFDLTYLASVLRSRNLNDIASKTAQPLITGTQVRDQRVPQPPLEEQSAIVNFLDRETAKLDTLTTEAKTAITLLQERRTALISAAVTGKIDVRGLVSAKTEVQAETVPC